MLSNCSTPRLQRLSVLILYFHLLNHLTNNLSPYFPLGLLADVLLQTIHLPQIMEHSSSEGVPIKGPALPPHGKSVILRHRSFGTQKRMLESLETAIVIHASEAFVSCLSSFRKLCFLPPLHMFSQLQMPDQGPFLHEAYCYHIRLVLEFPLYFYHTVRMT